jgi:putative peptide zinc metalloprotease protein
VSDSPFSPSWYRVSSLRPRLRSHVKILRQVYRDQIWFVLQDAVADKAHRFPPAVYHFISLMDGQRTVQEIWDLTTTQLGDSAPTQDEVIRLLGQLHSADALLGDLPPDSMEVFRRYQRHERMRWKKRFWSPLALRFPMFDPDPFLNRTFPWVEPLLGKFGFLIWLIVVTMGGVLAVSHWTDLTENITERVLSAGNLVLLWFVYPVVKAFHELGHAYVAKKWGAEVHDIGIMLLVLSPVPYVDASAAWGFKDKYKRMAVGAAGIGVELFLGSLALFVWLAVEPGMVRAIAYNVMLISGVSTLFFNGNPLLKFDGYYVMSDAIEIPNLGTRANRYLGYLFQRYLFKVADAESTAHSLGERAWLVFYGIASFIYRVFITFIIILFIAGKFFFVGIILAIWAITTQIMIPLSKIFKYLFTGTNLRRKRPRALMFSGMGIAGLGLLLFVMPFPNWTRTEGVIWIPEEAQVRAAVDGFIDQFLVPVDAHVVRGQPLIQAEEPFLGARVDVFKSQVEELQARYDALQPSDKVLAAQVREQMVASEADLKLAQQRRSALVYQSPANGRFIVPNATDLPGRFVTKGQLVGYVLEPVTLTVRVIVVQDDISMVKQNTRGVEVMLSSWDADPIPASIRRIVPGGSTKLPTPALGSAGGGDIAVNPQDNEGVTTLQQIFQLELELPQEIRSDFLGSRVYVRFDHGFEPAGFQVFRALSRLFLRHFNV